MSRGRFITLEGGEGVGKSTQRDLLARALRRAGVEVVTTREPGGSPGAEEIRALLVSGDSERWDAMTEALLHFAARRDHLAQTIRPALEAGRWIVSDRFADSTMAYQGCAQGLGREVVESLYRLVVGDLVPDLTLILDLPAEEGLRRTADRGVEATRYERMDAEFHGRLREAFLDIARREPKRCAVIAAGESVEAIHRAIVAAVNERLGMALEPS